MVASVGPNHSNLTLPDATFTGISPQRKDVSHENFTLPKHCENIANQITGWVTNRMSPSSEASSVVFLGGSKWFKDIKSWSVVHIANHTIFSGTMWDTDRHTVSFLVIMSPAMTCGDVVMRNFESSLHIFDIYIHILYIETCIYIYVLLYIYIYVSKFQTLDLQINWLVGESRTRSTLPFSKSSNRRQ